MRVSWLRSLGMTPYVAAFIGVLVALNVVYSVQTVLRMPDVPFDWAIFVQASERVRGDGLYTDAEGYSYRYSPVLAWAFAAVGWIGPTLWRAMHVAAALAMPSWRLRAATLLAWPFWHDVETGNVVVFVLLSAAWAMRGNRLGLLTFFAWTLLVPRPLMLPIAGWLLWRHPASRTPFAAMLGIHAIAVLGTGWGIEWVGQLAASTEAAASAHNLSPSRFVGLWWLVVGLPLAAWLTARSHVGLAALAVSPYLLPQYLLIALIDLRHVRFDRLRALAERVSWPTGARAARVDGRDASAGGSPA